MSAQTYLVGGAVRDELLGLEIGERDWVVTGSTPEALIKQGYRQVGSSFPVFLHPDTAEEHALARTERKEGHGYHGFSVDFHPGVTIEEDLQRRDLTINAMARSEDGHLIDPYGGQRDIEQRVLRHVSEAFAEDPLRVLRVARFAARFARLGFSVAPETLQLMKNITASGELDHLVPERAWNEVSGAMGSPNPSVFVGVLRDCGALAVLLPEVDALYGIPQQVRWHPEVDTGLHLDLALDMAASLGCVSSAVFAVLLHDLGKALTPPADLPAHHGHEATGLPLVDRVCQRFRVPNATHKLARQVCAHHLRCHRVLVMQPGKIMKLLEQLDAIRSRSVHDFTRACEADYRGRKGLQDRDYPQGRFLSAALETVLGIRLADLPPDAAATGPELGDKLRAARIEAIADMVVNHPEYTGGRGP